MKSRSIYFFTLCALLLSTFAYAAGPSVVYEKKLSETFAIGANGRVELDNRYGEIKVNTWNKASVKIDVLIRVEADSESEFQDVLKQINVSLTGGGNRVSGVTSIETSRRKGSWWTYILGSDDVNDFKVYYTVSMPATVQLEVDAQKLRTVNRPVRLFADEGEVDQRDQTLLQLVANSLGGVFGQRIAREKAHARS